MVYWISESLRFRENSLNLTYSHYSYLEYNDKLNKDAPQKWEIQLKTVSLYFAPGFPFVSNYCN